MCEMLFSAQLLITYGVWSCGSLENMYMGQIFMSRCCSIVGYDLLGGSKMIVAVGFSGVIVFN